MIELKADEGDAVVEALAGVLRSLGGGSFELTRARDQRAVPAISNSHLSAAQQQRVASAFGLSEHDAVYAVAMEPLKNMPLLSLVGKGASGLAEFNSECSHFNYVLTSVSAASIVLCTTDDYLVFVGTPSFVIACAGVTEEQARADFIEYATDPTWNELSRRVLKSVSDVCAAFEALPVGGTVELPWGARRT